MDFLNSTPVMLGMGAILLALIGLMVFMRMKKSDDE